MPARAGSLPVAMSDYYSRKNLSYDYLSGWHLKRAQGWQKKVKEKGHAFTRTLYSPDGTAHRVKVYGIRDKETKTMRPIGYDYIGYGAGDAPNLDEFLAKAEHAFTGKHKDSVKGVGHIAQLEYALEPDNTKYGILRVTFANGDICLFFNVPPMVYGTLRVHALRESTCGTYKSHGKIKQRHLLGVEFWNLVRIRGHHWRAKFPFSYEQKTPSIFARYENRHVVSLSRGDLAYLMSNTSPRSKFRMRYDKFMKANDKVQVVLNDEEYAIWAKEKMLREAEKDPKYGASVLRLTEFQTDENGISAEESVATGKGNYSAEHVGIHGVPHSAKYQLADKLIDEIEASVNRLDESKFMNADILKREGEGDVRARRHAIMDWYQKTDKPYAEAIDKNVKIGEDKLRLKDSYKDPNNFNKIARAADYGNNALRGWDQENFPAKETIAVTTCKPWTPKQLVEFGNWHVPGNIDFKDSYAYNKFIKRQDWFGALNFLKNVKVPYKYKRATTKERDDKTGRYTKTPANYIEEKTEMIHYAGDNDYLDLKSKE